MSLQPNLKNSKSFLFALFLLVSVGAVKAVPLTTLQESKDGNWSAGTMRNDDSGREFCFAETKGDQGTIFRVVMYKVDKDWFIEILNDNWNFRDGTINFSFEFDNGYVVELKGKSEGDSLTHDLLDLDATLATFGLMVKSQRMRLKNSNDGFLDDFALNGSTKALQLLTQCAGF